jgi:hypothetical protein
MTNERLRLNQRFSGCKLGDGDKLGYKLKAQNKSKFKIQFDNVNATRQLLIRPCHQRFDTWHVLIWSTSPRWPHHDMNWLQVGPPKRHVAAYYSTTSHISTTWRTPTNPHRQPNTGTISIEPMTIRYDSTNKGHMADTEWSHVSRRY